MKKLATCLIGVVGLIGTPAFAADMAVKAPRPLPAPAPVFRHESDGASFTDLGQNGLGAAGSIARPPFMSFSGGAVAARIVPQHSWSADLDSTFIGGGTLGCNWQPVGSPFVLGLEGEGGYMRLSGQAFDPRTIVSIQTTPDVLGSAKVGDWYAMITGRLGYAWDRTLLYVKGGAAFVPTQASVVDQCQNTAAGCGNWLIATSGPRRTCRPHQRPALPLCDSVDRDFHRPLAGRRACPAPRRRRFHARSRLGRPTIQAASPRRAFPGA